MISVVIPTFNVEHILERCLKSVSWTDEIIVVDMGSTDKTIEIAKKYKAKIFRRIPIDGNFDTNRKYGMEKAKGDWLLKIDSDEEMTSELAKDIREAVGNDSNVGFYLKNKIVLLGHVVSHGFVNPNGSELRLVKKGHWKYVPFKFHQQISVDGPTKTLGGYYYHYNFDDVSTFIKKTNKYTSLDAKHYNGRITSLIAIVAPMKSFIKLFFLKAGYRDKNGFEVCYLFSLYNLIEKVKVYEYSKQK